ncbi:MAG TPA: hypothetical protein VK994_02995, partial [Bacteroidales bacterium]|nr:hypothetical protein [Bacteroidales bacterium]
MSLKNIVYICFFLLVPAGIHAQDTIHMAADIPFQRGEKAKYRVFYDSWLTAGISAGVGYISILDDERLINGRKTFRFEVIGKSVGLF